jgi:excisionase family DNA binding protein
MHRRLQFGMRENPASDRRHGSRFAADTQPHSEYKERDESPQRALTPSEGLPVANSQDSLHAANEAATEGRRPENRLLTVHEVADLLQVPVSWVYGRTRRRCLEQLPGYRLGKYWRFRQSDIFAWIDRQRGGLRGS